MSKSAIILTSYGLVFDDAYLVIFTQTSSVDFLASSIPVTVSLIMFVVYISPDNVLILFLSAVAVNVIAVISPNHY